MNLLQMLFESGNLVCRYRLNVEAMGEIILEEMVDDILIDIGFQNDVVMLFDNLSKGMISLYFILSNIAVSQTATYIS